MPQPLLEPHTAFPAVEKRMAALWEARWGEHVLECHMKLLGPVGDSHTKLANTPLQLYLIYNRLCRARLEIDIYSEVLSR